MKQLSKVFIFSAVTLVLAACSQASLDRYTAGLDRFTAAVEKTDATIAKVSPTLYKNCGNAEAIGAQLASAVDTSTTAGAGLTAINAAIRASCKHPPNDTASAISNIIAAVVAAKAAYKSAKAGN